MSEVPLYAQGGDLISESITCTFAERNRHFAGLEPTGPFSVALQGVIRVQGSGCRSEFRD